MQNHLQHQSPGDDPQQFGLQQQLLAMNALQQQQGGQAQQLSMLQQMRNAGDGLQGDMGGQNISIQQMLQLRNLQQQDMANQQAFNGGGMGAGMLNGNNEMLMQLLQQQQQQQQIPQPFGGMGFGGHFGGGPDGISSNQLALERELLLRQQQGAHQGMHGNDHMFASGLAGLQGAPGGQFGGYQDSNNQLLLQLLQQQQQQQQLQHQQQMQANIQMAESVGSNQVGLRAGNAGNRGASHPTAAVAPEGAKAIKKKTYKKRPKDKPKRPLSAYNFFFKEERARILSAAAAAAAEDEGSKESGANEEHDGKEGDDAEKAENGGKEDKQRKGRSRPHGKISFEDLGRLISQRWQELNPEEVDYYKKKSDDDRKRYQEEMDEYRKKKAGN